jgi:hypothetical protein
MISVMICYVVTGHNFSYSHLQARKNVQDGASDSEIPKFDGAGYDKDLVEALERDIVSRNPSIHW